MFNDKKLIQLEERLIQDEKIFNETKDLINEIQRKLLLLIKETKTEIQNETENRLVNFHKEITDKCFSSMETIMKYTKEVSLIETLANQIKDKDLIALQTSLMQPILERQWSQEKREQVDKIEENLKTMGDKILEKRQELYNKFLTLNREKKDTKEVELELRTLDWIIENKQEQK